MVSTIPKHEPELRRAKGRAYAARCNEIATNYDRKTIHQALELSEQAHEVHQLPYVAGLSHFGAISARPVRMDLRANRRLRLDKTAGQA
jgi:hypothetical protein